MPLTRRLADFAANLIWADLPDAIRARMKMSTLDAIAVMAGAAAFLKARGDLALWRLADLSQAEGQCTLVGMQKTAAPTIAALVNGTLAEVLDFSDCVLTARNHPSAPVLPGILAAAGTCEASGPAFLTAIAAGYEVFTRVCQAIQPSHGYRGFQCTGTIGACGAAVGASKLRGAGAEEMNAALGIAGFVMPVSNGDNIFRGHSIKPVHGGQGAASGMTASLLAAAGMRSGPLEGEPPRFHGPLPIVADNVDTERALAGLGESWRIMELAYKPFPIGLLNIGPVEICKALVAEGLVKPAEIDRIAVRSYKDAAHFVTKYTTVESSYIDCYLSLPYCIAVALMDGDLWLDQLEEPRIADPNVHALARRITIEEDPEMTARYPHEWPVQIAVHCRDGSRVVRRVDAVMWSPRRPPSWEDIVTKFQRLTGELYGNARANEIVERVAGLDQAADIGGLLRLL